MKALSLDTRERVVAFVGAGGSKVEAARVFGICRKSVYNYLGADKAGTLEPKKSWGRWRKLDPDKLAAHSRAHQDATLEELAEHFGVCVSAVWKRLGQMGVTLKKSRGVFGKGRGKAGGVQGRAEGVKRKGAVLA
jgi:transposase